MNKWVKYGKGDAFAYREPTQCWELPDGYKKHPIRRFFYALGLVWDVITNKGAKK